MCWLVAACVAVTKILSIPITVRSYCVGRKENESANFNRRAASHLIVETVTAGRQLQYNVPIPITAYC
jgi:hypothetical protein